MSKFIEMFNKEAVEEIVDYVEEVTEGEGFNFPEADLRTVAAICREHKEEITNSGREWYTIEKLIYEELYFDEFDTFEEYREEASIAIVWSNAIADLVYQVYKNDK